jgi:predicted component of viral defense system (DUF524 family)
MVRTIQQIDLEQKPIPAISEHEAVEFRLLAGEEPCELKIAGVVIEPFLRPNDHHWYWRWNPGAAVGGHRLEWCRAAEQHTLLISVLPRKVDQEHYALLLADLQCSAADLLFRISGAVHPAVLGRNAASDTDALTEYYALIEAVLPGFVRAVQQISRQPRERLSQASVQVPLGQAHMIDPSFPIDQLSTADATILPALQASLGGLPSQTRAHTSHTTADTYENRLLVRTLEILLRRVNSLTQVALQAQPGSTPARQAELHRIQQGCQLAQQQLRELRALPWLAMVSSLEHYQGVTPALQRDTHYRAVLRSYLALRRSPQLAFDTPYFRLPIVELPQIYEYWCILQVARSLIEAIGAPTTQYLFQLDMDQPQLRLATEDVLEAAYQGATIRLRYQPRYRPFRVSTNELHSLDRHTRVPDIAIELHRKGEQPRVLIFDAKYRLDADGASIPQDALAEAYAYRGAIGCAQAAVVDAAYILYPGQNQPECYSSGVGAIPLLPGMPNGLTQVLREWVERIGSNEALKQ